MQSSNINNSTIQNAKLFPLNLLIALTNFFPDMITSLFLILELTLNYCFSYLIKRSEKSD